MCSYGYYISLDPNQFIEYHFKIPIEISGYKRSTSLQNYLVETSIDGLNWSIMHEIDDNEEEDIQYFELDHLVICTYLRIKNTGEYQSYMRYFDLFGNILTNESSIDLQKIS